MAYTHTTLAVTSELLRGNPAGDPHERTLHVLAPDSIEAPLPVVWILVGHGGTPAAQLLDDPWSENLLQRLERLRREGKLRDAIFVLPDCFTSLGGSQYLNSTALGPYEDHLWQELKPLVESRFPCGAMGLAGKSSGGYGALVQAMRHPEHVRAIAAHAPDVCFEYCYLPDVPKLASALEREGGLDGFLAAFAAAPKKRDGRFMAAMNALCMAACYSPNPDAPHGIELPFDEQTGALRPKVWSRWLTFDPLRMVEAEAHVAALSKLSLLYLDCGRFDEFQLQWGLRQLVAKLRARGVSLTHEEFDGGHMGTSYRYDRSLPELVAALS